MPKAVVLLSGGLDSSTVLAIAKEQKYDIIALTIDYGQRHKRELESARKIARHFRVKEHIVLSIDLGRHLGSSLTKRSMKIPLDRPAKAMSSRIPTTYVPSRNIIFLSIAASIAESRGAEAVFIAANAVDFSGYPDCTPDFVKAFQRALDKGTKSGRVGRGIRVEAPLLRSSKTAIVREALRLEVPLEMTWSCYEGGKKACGRCDSCRLRLRGFKEAGVIDPLGYEVRD